MEVPGITIRPLAATEIAQLERAPWSSGLKEKHRQRFQRQQEGEVSYLILWQGDTPIGHLLLKWSGPHDPQVASRITDCAEIEDFVVRQDVRSQGIGRRALEHAATLTRARGMARLGLAVGLDNPRARALYERVGFTQAAVGTIVVRWQGPAPDGGTRWYEQQCMYLVKDLAIAR